MGTDERTEDWRDIAITLIDRGHKCKRLLSTIIVWLEALAGGCCGTDL